MNKGITFKDFLSKCEYLKLQDGFLRSDERSVVEPKDILTNTFKEEFTIIFKTTDDITFKERYEKVGFYKDFILPKVILLSDNYINSFKNKLNRDLITEKEKIELLGRNELELFISRKKDIENAEYLNSILIAILLNQIEIIINYLENVHILPNYSFADKIKFNLDTSELLVLIQLFRKNKIISHPNDSEIGTLLDKYFLYLNSDNNDYKELKNSRKVLNNIKNENKPVEKALKRLKSIFTSDDFFDYPLN